MSRVFSAAKHSHFGFRILFPPWIKKQMHLQWMMRLPYSASQPALAEHLLCARHGPRDAELRDQRFYSHGTHSLSGSQWRENVIWAVRESLGSCAQVTRRGQGGNSKM